MRISIDDIKNNMIIDEDIYNSNGRLILSKGLSVSDENFIKDLLKRNAINKIKVLMLFDIAKEDNEQEDVNVPFEVIKEQEIESFMTDFNNVVNSFEKEIISTISGTGNAKSLENILSETIKTNSGKNTNVFQLLQKFKNSDDLTFVHCNAVSLTVHTIGKWMKLSESDLKDLSLAGLLFDVGKYALSKDLLRKTTPLTEFEIEVIRSHVEKSLEMLKPYDLNDNIIDAIKYHHERCDGSGYPYGLKGDEIPLLARILALADVFVALTSMRPYRNKMTPFAAVKLLETDFMQKLDIVILSDFINKIASNYIGAELRLSDGNKGEIIFINANAPLRPIVKLKPTGDLLDLSSKANHDIEIEEFF